MKSVLSAIDSISVWTGKMSSFLIVLATGIVIFEVIARYVFDSPTSWGLELTIFVCGVTYLLGMAYVHQLRRHIAVDVLTTRLSKRQKAIIDSLAFLFILTFVSILVWKGVEATWQSLVRGETTGSQWNPPDFPFRLAIPLGFFLLILQAVSNFIRDLYLAITGRGYEP